MSENERGKVEQGKVVWDGTVEIREFDDTAWSSYSSAERFADGGKPVICEQPGLAIVAGGQGVEVILCDSFGDQPSFILPFKLPTQDTGVLLIVALAEHVLPCIESGIAEETRRVLKLYGFVSREVVGN